MITRGLIFVIALIACVGFAAAQNVHTPDKGSAERKAILDALRSPVERDLKQPVIFAIDNFNVSGNWAFIGGTPQTSDGGRPDYSRTKYADAVDSGAFDNNIFALLKKSAGKWKVVTHLIGCTDVCYATWWKDHRAPKALFPYNY
jgi:hypothetical protein